MIVVTGATGNIGHELTRLLLTKVAQCGPWAVRPNV